MYPRLLLVMKYKQMNGDPWIEHLTMKKASGTDVT